MMGTRFCRRSARSTRRFLLLAHGAFLVLLVACQPPSLAPAALSPAAVTPSAATSAPAVSVAPPVPTPTATTGPTTTLRIGAPKASVGDYAYAVALGKIVTAQVPGWSGATVEVGSPAEVLRQLQAGQVQLGLTTEEERTPAQRGLGEWKDHAIPDVRVLWLYQFHPCPPIVRAGGPIHRFEDLKDKTVNPGPPGSAIEAQTKRFFAAIGVEPKWFVGSTAAGLGALQAGNISAVVHCFMANGSPDPGIADFQQKLPIRLLPLAPEHVPQILAKAPGVVIGPVPTYDLPPGQPPPVTAIGVSADVAALANLPEDVAYRLTKAAAEDNRPGGAGLQAKAFPPVSGFDLARETINLTNSPIHASALRYYRELGLPVEPQQVPPEAK